MAVRPYYYILFFLVWRQIHIYLLFIINIDQILPASNPWPESGGRRPAVITHIDQILPASNPWPESVGRRPAVVTHIDQCLPAFNPWPESGGRRPAVVTHIEKIKEKFLAL